VAAEKAGAAIDGDKTVEGAFRAHWFAGWVAVLSRADNAWPASCIGLAPRHYLTNRDANRS
jgi:hypothetical protein